MATGRGLHEQNARLFRRPNAETGFCAVDMAFDSAGEMSGCEGQHRKPAIPVVDRDGVTVTNVKA